jgi:hypothetical protein
MDSTDRPASIDRPITNVGLTPYQAQILVNALADAAEFRHHGRGRCPWGNSGCRRWRRCEDCKQDSEEVAIYEAMAPQFVAIARLGSQS